MTFLSIVRRFRPWLLTIAVLPLVTCARGSGSIILGLAGPMTDPLGVAQLKAARLAVAQINQRGGLHGRQVQLRVVDDSGSGSGAVVGAQALYDDPEVVAVVGHITSGTSIVAARIYGGGDRPLAMVSPTASSPELSGINSFSFRVCPSDLQHGPALARFARQRLAARRAAVIYLNDEYGRGVRTAFANEFANLGGTVVEQDPYLASTTSLEPYITRMRNAGVDVLMVAADVPGTQLVLRELRRQNLHWPVIGSDALVGIEADGPLAEGVHISSAYLSDRPGEKNATFVLDYFRATQGERPSDVAGLTYDVVMLLAQAIETAGPDRRAIREYLASVGPRRPAFEGVSGHIAFDGDGDVPGKPLTIAIVRNGKLVAEASE